MGARVSDLIVLIVVKALQLVESLLNQFLRPTNIFKTVTVIKETADGYDDWLQGSNYAYLSLD